MLSKKLFFSSIVLFVLLGSPLIILVEAEPSWLIWSQTYGGIKEDRANSLIETSDGGYALAGNTRSFGAGDEDFWLVKANEQGVPEFPSWTPLLITLVAVVVVAVVYRHKLKKQSQGRFDVK